MAALNRIERVKRLALEGHSAQKIAELVGVSRSVVQYHRSRARRWKGHASAIAHADFEAIKSRCAVTESGCMVWTKALSRNGYALLSGHLVHRLAYEARCGKKLNRDTVLHHACHNRACVNPDHLHPMSRVDHGRLHRERVM
jgi:hypothetical protein